MSVFVSAWRRLVTMRMRRLLDLDDDRRDSPLRWALLVDFKFLPLEVLDKNERFVEFSPQILDLLL
jgi:hypothetical protein